MKRLVMTLALTCVLSISALAGDIPTSDTPAPGDIPTSDSPAPGDIPTSDAPQQVSEAALSALLSVLSGLVV